MAKLILVRHGESLWNAKGKWTGLTDISLSEKGIKEAEKAGRALKDVKIDIAFVSSLKRAKQTLNKILTVLGLSDIKVVENNALNERDYGDLTGKNKWQVQKELGDDKFQLIRRGWDYPVPGGETLKDVFGRMVPYYKNYILPELEKNNNVIISAHGNSLRALIKYLENVSDRDISNIELKTGEVYIYDIDNSGKIRNKKKIYID